MIKIKEMSSSDGWLLLSKLSMEELTTDKLFMRVKMHHFAKKNSKKSQNNMRKNTLNS